MRALSRWLTAQRPVDTEWSRLRSTTGPHSTGHFRARIDAMRRRHAHLRRFGARSAPGRPHRRATGGAGRGGPPPSARAVGRTRSAADAPPRRGRRSSSTSPTPLPRPDGPSDGRAGRAVGQRHRRDLGAGAGPAATDRDVRAGTRCPTRRPSGRRCAGPACSSTDRWWSTTTGPARPPAGAGGCCATTATPTSGCWTAAGRPGWPTAARPRPASVDVPAGDFAASRGAAAGWWRPTRSSTSPCWSTPGRRNGTAARRSRSTRSPVASRARSTSRPAPTWRRTAGSAAPRSCARRTPPPGCRSTATPRSPSTAAPASPPSTTSSPSS